MPMYSCKCERCGKANAYFAKVAERDQTPTCCDAPTTKTLDTPMVSAMAFSGHKGFVVPGTQTWIEDGASMKKYMSKNNLTSETEGQQEVVIRQTERANADDQKLETAVVNAYRAHTGGI